MGSLKEIRTRIVSVKNTQKITKAMKLVAASKLRKAQERILQMRPYSVKLSEMMTNIISGSEGDVSVAYAKERAEEKILLVIISSDRGLCGGFNSNIAKMVRSVITEKYAEQRDAGNVTVMCIGKKGHDALKKYNELKFDLTHIDLFKDLTFENSAKVSEELMQSFVDKKYDVIEMGYNQFKNQITQIPTVDRFLPIKKLVAEAPKEGEKKEMNADYTFEPDQATIIEELVPKILKTQFYRYLLDSNASEQGARMTAMANATENAEDLLKELKLTFNRARQAAITTELTEIVSGAAALKG